MPSESSQMISGIVAMLCTSPLGSMRSNSTPVPARVWIGPPTTPSSASPRGIRPDRSIRRPENQPVPDADDPAWAELERPVLDRGERLGVPAQGGRIRACVMPQRHDREDGEDADEDEDAFHDASRDVAEREDLVLPLEERDQHNGGADVRDDQDQFQERAKVDAVVGTGSGDVALGIVENGLKQPKRRDRGGEGDEVKRAKRHRDPSLWAHVDSSRRVTVAHSICTLYE